jgi:hypothetical protein
MLSSPAYVEPSKLKRRPPDALKEGAPGQRRRRRLAHALARSRAVIAPTAGGLPEMRGRGKLADHLAAP